MDMNEPKRRIQLGWTVFRKLDPVSSSRILQILKTKFFNQCVLPLIRGTEVSNNLWSRNVQSRYGSSISSRSLSERDMFGVYLRDGI